ncbi:hypothetical protein PUNSTDRAFT_19350, partial [Punctularia strigosozonata HHB-11173 SS5]|uniref:uncharacterized protein n=1 Tax=Punctularia strigosozonata (strain HHB-11173) TaxID=741275 RepID=UPI0004417078
ESPLHIPRPPNPWILFRSDFNRRQIRESKTRQAFVSQDASKEWRKASKEDLAYWRQKADEALDAHRKLYPNYVYKPQRGK